MFEEIDDHPDAEMQFTTSSEEEDDNISAARKPPAGQDTDTMLAATQFAPQYRSMYLSQVTAQNKAILKGVAHLNCAYVSTPGIAPSLIQLKQHAQSLAILIKNLSISTQPSVINAANIGKTIPAANDAETWDWLNDLTKPYQGPENPDLFHHQSLPLTSLLNTLEQGPCTGGYEAGVREVCPLYNAGQQLRSMPNGSSLPYATHQSLINHANTALELIDQQYSAKGGLLGILPLEDEKDDRAKAESTLLGQYILYTQRLVSRLHELEREHANALDVLAGESRVPLQMLSDLGAEGRKGRDIVFPQDKFVLVNAGQDVYSYLDREFNQKEIADDAVRKNYIRHGVTGEKLWAKKGGVEYQKGLTAIDVTTRYYRLRKDDLKTIFIIPAWQSHPGVSATVELEQKPTVVSVVRPVWPERVSLWEQKNRESLAQVGILQRENAVLKSENMMNENSIKFVNLENEKRSQENRELSRALKAIKEGEQSKAGRDFIARIEAIEDREAEAQLQQSEAANARREANRILEEAAEERRAVLEESAKRRAVIEGREKYSANVHLARLRTIEDMERRFKMNAREWQAEKNANWEKTIGELEKAMEGARNSDASTTTQFRASERSCNEASANTSDPNVAGTDDSIQPTTGATSVLNAPIGPARSTAMNLKANPSVNIASLKNMDPGAWNNAAASKLGTLGTASDNFKGDGYVLSSFTITPADSEFESPAESGDDIYGMSE